MAAGTLLLSVPSGDFQGFLEVFYDLVYVGVIGQASHQLAQDISARGVVEFAIMFG